MKNFLLIISVIFFFVSCHGNKIYYDNSKKAIVCKKGIIKHLRITDQVIFDSFIIDLVDSKRGNSIFYLFCKNEGYQITRYARGVTDSLKIEPNVKYLIENSSYPDATTLGVEIEFDSVFNVKHVDIR